jgi:uncharacterized protein (DUF952 family)
MILHITHQDRWQQAQQIEIYQADSLITEGFIHCSHPEQVIGVADRFYRGQDSLVLLCINPDLVEANIKYEAADGQIFPHVYGALNLDAIVDVLDFPPNPDGSFSLPKELAAK